MPRNVKTKRRHDAASRSLPSSSASTSAYCQARAKLDISELETILSHTASTLHDQGRTERWKGRRVVVVDGTGLSMPDTAENQAMWPQTRAQKPGCSFPQASVCACFCLHTEMLEQRIDDRAFLGLIRKWLKTGILETDGKVIHPETGTPQGGIVTPLNWPASIYTTLSTSGLNAW